MMHTAAPTMLHHTRIDTGRRVVALIVMLAWSAWVIACPEALVGIDGVAFGTPVHSHRSPSAVHLHGDVDRGAADDDLCCTALQQVAALVQAHASKAPNLSHALLPVVTTDVIAVLVASNLAATTQWLVHGPPSLPRRSPALGALWPHAPPR